MVVWVSRNGQRLTEAMAVDYDGMNNEFHQVTGCWLGVSSGVRTDAEQEAIFRQRYVPRNQVNGRRVYDWRWWNGVQWGRISSAGTVAVPGTSNHQINLSAGRRGALDLYDTGSDAGLLTRGSWRANVFDSIAGKYGYDSEGYNFGENWHKRYNRDPYRTVTKPTPPPPPKPSKTPEQIDEEEIEVGTAEILSGLRREHRLRKFGDSEGRRAVGMPGCVIPLPKNPEEAVKYMTELSKFASLIFPSDELNGLLPTYTPAMFNRIVDTYDPTNQSQHGYGEFVKNTFDLKAGPSIQVRENPSVFYTYSSRNEVWADLRPVELTYNKEVIVKLLAKGTARFAELANGQTVPLTSAEVDRANSQRPAGQTWIPA